MLQQTRNEGSNNRQLPPSEVFIPADQPGLLDEKNLNRCVSLLHISKNPDALLTCRSALAVSSINFRYIFVTSQKKFARLQLLGIAF